jgi:hypothetical protein
MREQNYIRLSGLLFCALHLKPLYCPTAPQGGKKLFVGHMFLARDLLITVNNYLLIIVWDLTVNNRVNNTGNN